MVTGRLRDYINVGVAISLTATAIALARRDVFDAMKEDVVYGLLSIALLVATLIRMVLYHSAVRTEVDLLEWALNTKQVLVLRGPVLPIVVGLSVTFAAQIATVTNILVFSALFMLFTALDMFGPIVIMRNVGAVMIERRFADEAVDGAARAIYDYYYGNPTILRVAIMLLASVGSFVLAILWHYEKVAAYQYAAYALAITTVVVGEVVMKVWRQRRDREVERLTARASG